MIATRKTKHNHGFPISGCVLPLPLLSLFALPASMILHGATASPTAIPTKFLGMDVHGDPVLLPLVGAGTWQYNDTIAYQSVCKAFHAGYTFVDTALGYGNQRGVGKAIQDCWEGERSDLFVMTKIPGGLNASQVRAAHKQNLLELGLDYVDHLMTHFPSDWDEKVGKMQGQTWLQVPKWERHAESSF